MFRKGGWHPGSLRPLLPRGRLWNSGLFVPRPASVSPGPEAPPRSYKGRSARPWSSLAGHTGCQRDAAVAWPRQALRRAPAAAPQPRGFPPRRQPRSPRRRSPRKGRWSRAAPAASPHCCCASVSARPPVPAAPGPLPPAGLARSGPEPAPRLTGTPFQMTPPVPRVRVAL